MGDNMDKYYTDTEVENWFGYHPPGCAHIIRAHEQIRREFASLAVSMNNLLPEGPDKSVALRAIRDAMYQANACVAVAQDVYDHENRPETVNVAAAATPKCEQCGGELVFSNKDGLVHDVAELEADHKPVL